MKNSTMFKNEAKDNLEMKIAFMSSLSFLVCAEEFSDWAEGVRANILSLLNYLAVEVRRLSQIVFGT